MIAKSLPDHSEKCETFISRMFGLYDKTCPRCCIVYEKSR